MDRLTHAHDGDLAVFLIGMTVRKPWRPDLWGPTFAAMPPMLRELAVNRARSERGEEEWLGFYDASPSIGPRGPLVVQYWRSVEDIYRYASDQTREHRPRWAEFNRRARAADGAVGVWHETYAVPAGSAETVYTGVGRPLGLGRATGVVPATRRGETARQRLGSSVTGSAPA